MTRSTFQASLIRSAVFAHSRFALLLSPCTRPRRLMDTSRNLTLIADYPSSQLFSASK